jgi:hypothetical protein
VWPSLSSPLERPGYGVQKPGTSGATASAQQGPLLPGPLGPQREEPDRIPRMRWEQSPLPATSGGSRPLKSSAPRRLRRPGRGALGHALSRAERIRTLPKAAELSRAEPSRAARSRLVQLRPYRSAVGGSGVAAASAGPAPAACPPAGREGGPQRGESGPAAGAAATAAAR